jgi:hypothetical protein
MSPQYLRWAFLPSGPKGASEQAFQSRETTRGAGRGRRLVLLGEEIYGSAGGSTTFPAKTNVWEKPSVSQRAQRALFRGVEHDRPVRPIEDVSNEAVLTGCFADAVGASAAIDHEPWLCHHDRC